MPEDRRKMYTKKETGTVPKIKHHNMARLNQDEHNVVSNNLGRDSSQPNFLRLFGHPERNLHSAHLIGMDSLIEEHGSVQSQNGLLLSTNGSLSTTNTSESVSRRNSLGTVPKCDNVSKYPDKKQIEDKLNQIREYLHITSSLMSNVKNEEDQSTDPAEYEHLEKTYNDLRDSEAKLVAMLADIDDYDKSLSEDGQNEEQSSENGFDNSTEPGAPKIPKNVLEKKVEHANWQLQMLREQENLLLNLQLKAENQLREARHAQQKLVTHQNTNLRHMEEAMPDMHANEFGSGNYLMSNKNLNENHDVLWELEDRLKMLKSDLPSSSSRQSALNIHEHFQAQVESLQQKINQIRDANDNRSHLIQMLDNRDTQLQAEHLELQNKLLELQNKKLHVDHLVSQLQNVNDESEEEDVAIQVKKLVSMKQQLSKLKDMLEVVKNTEGIFESQNVKESDVEAQDNTNSLITKTDNLIQNDVRSNQLTNRSDNVSNVRQENNPAHYTNERRVKEKQVNKKSMNANERERLKLQVELQAKKRELEELMCKHKAASSNLNQDVHCENKSEMGATSNSLYEDTANSWWPITTNIYHLPNSSERYSSDECPEEDMNEYSELNSSGEASNIHLIHPMPALNYQASNYIKRTEAKPRLEVPEDSSCPRATSRSRERSVQNTTSTAPTAPQRNERGRSNSNEQIQKQLQLIRSVCDSMLDQQNSNHQNVRNNLTPSSVYSEPRQFSSPNPHPMNALNVVNSPPDSTWLPPAHIAPQGGVPLNETSNYQNWLATNTLQTQAFMLNTLNQCCQMLWLQQRELAALRNTVSSMQERLQTNTFDQQTNLVSACMNSNPCLYPIIPPQDSHRNSQARTTNNPKANQVSSATSLPNLNHPHVPQTNSESAFASQNNMHNARVLESGLNNMIHPHQTVVGDHVNNTVLHSVNHALPSQIWNGQALNNQVAPGNRANNYWDNFRSYSRQNLLSSKSNEGLQNQTSSAERSNNSSERSQTLTFLPLSAQKHNVGGHNDSSDESAPPRRRTGFKTSSRSMLNTDPIPAVVPPDVPNITDVHSTDKMNESGDVLEIPLPPMNQSGYSTASDMNFQSFLNSVSHSESSMSHSNLSDGHTCKDCSCNHRNRNEWQPESNFPKSKLFDELRENVYKEVASLISANQGRPHFLIQLFRDLQLISSDPLRRRTLQSIQTLISHSLVQQGNTQSTTRQTLNPQSSSGMENDALVNCPMYFDGASNLWNHSRSAHIDDISLDSDCQEHLSEVLTFLNTHAEDVFQQNLLESLKELLVESTFSTIFYHTNVKDGIIQKHFANLVAETLEQYRGKKVQDVRLNILQTIEDLLRGEISLIRLMRENMAENCDLNSVINNEAAATLNQQQGANAPYDLQAQFNSCLASDENVSPPQIQNGDLAEADQSRLELEDEEEEGAVGGVLNILTDRNSSNAGQIGQDELHLPKIDFAINADSNSEFTEQGLDQVPTRLTTHSRSHSNTPNGDHSNSLRADMSDQL